MNLPYKALRTLPVLLHWLILQYFNFQAIYKHFLIVIIYMSITHIKIKIQSNPLNRDTG